MTTDAISQTTEAQQFDTDNDALCLYDRALSLLNGSAEPQEIMQCLEAAAKAGNPQAQYALGLFNLAGVEYPFAWNCWMKKWTARMEQSGFDMPWYKSAQELAVGLVRSSKTRPKDEKAGFDWLHLAAHQNHGEALYMLGQCYLHGIGTEQNEHAAFQAFQAAVAQGSHEAEFELGNCYLRGIATETSPDSALTLCQASAEAGYRPAQYALASIFFEWHQPEKGLSWLVRCIETDPYNVQSKKMRELGVVCEEDREISIDPSIVHDERLRRLMEYYFREPETIKSVIQGLSDYTTVDEMLAEGYYQLAVQHFDDIADEPNSRKGMDYLWEAVTLNHHDAKQRWANAFLQFTFPEFIGRDDEDACFKFAFEWCENRLEEVADDYEARFAMGVLLAFGKGCNADLPKAELIFERIHQEGNSVGMVANDEDNDLILWMASFYLARSQNWGNGFVYLEPNLAELFKADLQAQRMQINPNLIIPALVIDFSISFDDQALLAGVLNSLKQNRRREHAALQLSMRDKLSQALLEAVRQKTEALNQKQRAESAERELEETMAMFAHKFRSPLDAIIYNTSHEHQPKLYIQAAQTMRGLLDIFSIISTDADTLQEKLKQDCQGNGNLTLLFSKTLDMILLHLLSVSATEKIKQHYLRYAKAHGLCAVDLTYKAWNEEHFELERQLQSEWEQGYAQLLSESATLDQRLAWLEPRFFKLELQGFDSADIQFKEYGITESFLTILLNELLVNAFKYYASAEAQPVVVEWNGRDGFQVLSCRNPSMRSERSKLKGSGKGHIFLSALARKIGSQFSKPKPQDDFVVEFAIADQLLISS